MKKTIAAFILVLVSTTTMADENRTDGKVQLDTSAINVKLEQLLQERLKSEIAEDTAVTLRKLSSEGSADLLLYSMDYFKVDTSLPE